MNSVSNAEFLGTAAVARGPREGALERTGKSFAPARASEVAICDELRQLVDQTIGFSLTGTPLAIAIKYELAGLGDAAGNAGTSGIRSSLPSSATRRSEPPHIHHVKPITGV